MGIPITTRITETTDASFIVSIIASQFIKEQKP